MVRLACASQGLASKLDHVEVGESIIAHSVRRSFFESLVFLGLFILPLVARPASFDLTDWRLEESRENALAGEWLFFLAQLLEPTNPSQIREAGLSATLPSFFSEEKSGNPRSHGFGTYVTQVRLPDFARTTSMVLSLSPADTAGRFQVTDLDGNPLSPVVHQGSHWCR